MSVNAKLALNVDKTSDFGLTARSFFIPKVSKRLKKIPDIQLTNVNTMKTIIDLSIRFPFMTYGMFIETVTNYG